MLSGSPALTWPEGLAEGVRLVGRRDGTPGFDEVSKALRVTKAEFDAAVAAKKDLADPITGYQKILGSTRVYARTALELYDREKPDLLMVYFEGTDEIGTSSRATTRRSSRASPRRTSGNTGAGSPLTSRRPTGSWASS